MHVQGKYTRKLRRSRVILPGGDQSFAVLRIKLVDYEEQAGNKALDQVGMIV